MTATIDYEKVKMELACYLRNSDIYSIATRGVTTTTDSGTFAVPTSTYLIARFDVKNIRSVTRGTVLVYGTDYTYDYDTANGCLITFTNAQTGTYAVVYDYGTDKIFTDFPRADLSISSFPRIGIDMIGDDSKDIEIGAGTKETTFSFSIYVFDFKVKDIDATLTLIKNKMMQKQKGFVYQRYVSRIRTGPPMIFQTAGNTKIMFKSIDYLSKFNYEYV